MRPLLRLARRTLRPSKAEIKIVAQQLDSESLWPGYAAGPGLEQLKLNYVGTWFQSQRVQDKKSSWMAKWGWEWYDEESISITERL